MNAQLRPSIDKLFVSPGKRYHGVRYPQDGTIRPPLCVVTVLPEDGQAYQLDDGTKKKYIASEFDWGSLFRDMPKVEPPVVRQKYFKGANIQYDQQMRNRKDKDWQKVSAGNQRRRQLAFAILLDYYQTVKLAEAVYESLCDRVICKLPEKEFTLTAAQIEDAVGAEIALAAIAKIGE